MMRTLRHGLVWAAIGLSLAAGASGQEPLPAAQPTPIAPAGDPTADASLPAPAAGVAREIDAELERLRQALASVTEVRGELERAASERSVALDSAQERAAELTVALRASIAAGEPTDSIYDAVVAELQDARRGLRDALDTLRAASAVPSYAPRLDIETVDVARFRQHVESARDLLAQIQAAETEAQIIEQRARWTALETVGSLVRRLNDLRIECLDSLSPSRQKRVLGMTRDGVGQLLREVEHATLSGRLYRETRLHQMREAKTLTRDVFVIGSLSYAALRLGLVIAAALWVRARWRTWIDHLRRRLFRRAQGVVWKRRTEAVLTIAEAVTPWTLFLVAVAAVRWALRPAVTAPELAVICDVALIYGLYRLSIDLFVALFVRIAHRYRLRMAAERRTLLIKTVRWVMRIATPLLALVLVADRVVGHGYLFHVVVRFSWLVLLVTLLGVAITWRHVTAQSFVKAHPTGRLSRLVRTSQGRWYGILITPASVVWMAGRALIVLARDFAFGFEQTRKALAFVFRHRIERQAEVRGYAEGDIERLPDAVTQAFAEDAVSEGPLVIDFFPGLDQLQAAFEAWQDRPAGGSFLLTGERGSGKTSWLQQASSGDLPKTVITLDHRPASADDLAQLLGRRLLPDAGPPWSIERLHADLIGRPAQVVIVDLAQHLFLAAIGGYAAFDALAALIERTHDHVFWICGMSAFAWQRLSAVRSTPLVFRNHVALGGWTEERIRELIRARVAAADVRLNYGDLVVDRLEGVSTQARLIESEEGYTRLLWDYSDGNPRVALHFFLRSLVPETPGSVRVRLFRAPPLESLERLDEAALFTLAATITHENLTLEEAATVTRFPEQLCRIHLDRLAELGVLSVGEGRYRISTYWHRAAVRLLRRKNLLND